MALDTMTAVPNAPDAAQTAPSDTPAQPQTTPQAAPPTPTPASQTTATAPASAGQNSKAPGGVLGSIAIGALKGLVSHVTKGAVAVAKNTRVGQDIQMGKLERQQKQQEISTAQQAQKIAAQKAQQEAVAAMDEHTKSQVLTNGFSLDNAHKVIENAHLESMYPGQEEAQKITLKDQIRTQNKADIDFWGDLEAAGIPINIMHGAGHDGLTSDHARDVATGKVSMLNNGKEGDEAGYGFVDNTELQNTPLPSDVKVVSDWNLDPKTGAISPVYTTLAAGSNTAWDALIVHSGAMKKFGILQDTYEKSLETQQKKSEAEKSATEAKNEPAKESADITTKREEGEKDVEEGKYAAAEAQSIGGDVINDMAARLVDADMDPSQLPKRAANYDATLKAADDYSMSHYGRHFNIAQAQEDYKYATTPQTQNTLKYLNSVIPNMNDLVRQSDSIKRTQLPAINDAAAWARIQTGDPSMAAYNATITEVSDQIAKILQGGGTNSGTSDAKLKQAQDLFNKSFTPQQVKAVVGELGNLLGNRKSALIGDNRYLQKQYGQTTNAPVAPQVPPGKTPAYSKSTGAIIGYADDANGTNFHRF